jgi:hypothetical protein
MASGAAMVVAHFFAFSPMSTSWRWHRSPRLRTDRRAVEAEGSVDDDSCYGALSAPRRSGQARGARKAHQTASETRKTGSQKVNICQNETAVPVRMKDDVRDKYLKTLERVKGIEPSYSAWKAAALPLSYTRA